MERGTEGWRERGREVQSGGRLPGADVLGALFGDPCQSYLVTRVMHKETSAASMWNCWGFLPFSVIPGLSCGLNPVIVVMTILCAPQIHLPRTSERALIWKKFTEGGRVEMMSCWVRMSIQPRCLASHEKMKGHRDDVTHGLE